MTPNEEEIECNPIYDKNGIFIGTDDKGLQGDAIIMDAKNYKAGMSHTNAQKYDIGLDALTESARTKLLEHYNNLSNRPDYDGYLTLKEVNKWYRTGKGEPLFVDLNKIDLFYLYSKEESYVGTSKYINLFEASDNFNDMLVYGTIKLTRVSNNGVKADFDIYDFDKHTEREIRTF